MYKQYKLLIFKKAPPPVTYKQTNKKNVSWQVKFLSLYRKVKVKKKNNSMRENIKIDYKLQRF